MTQTSAWFLATRPKTLFASMGPVFLGLFLCLQTGKDLNPIIAFLTITSALLMQIGTNLVNDYFDFKTGVDSNNRLGPKRVTSEGLLSPKQVQTGYQLCFFLAFLRVSFQASLNPQFAGYLSWLSTFSQQALSRVLRFHVYLLRA